MKVVAVRPGERNSAQLLERPEPAFGPQEVLVQTLEVGLDGTDQGINAAEYGEAPRGDQWLIIGHEALGRIKSVGAEVRKLSAGDLVVPTVRRSCPEQCLPCSMGQSDFCLTGHYLERGIKGAHGFLAEVFVERPENLVRVAERLDRVAVLTEPLSIVVKGVDQAFRAQERLPWKPQQALVLGAGPIGLLATLLLRLRGLQVFTASREPRGSPETLIIEAAGAHYLNTNESPILGMDRQLGNLDLIIEGTGSSAVAFQALDILGTNGVLCLTGVSAGNRMREVPADVLNLEMVLGNKLVFGTVNSNLTHMETASETLNEMASRWPGLLEQIITCRLPLEEYRTALTEKAVIKTTVELAPHGRS